MKPIHVLEIISGFAVEGPLGGIERFGIELVQCLNPQRVKPILCGLWAYQTPYESKWLDHLSNKGIHAFIAGDWQNDAPYCSFLRAVKAIPALLGDQQIDIIHSHCQFGDIAALLLASRLKAKKLVRTVHNEREWPKRPLRRIFLTQLAFPWLFDAEIGVSQQVVDMLNQRPMIKLCRHNAIRIYNALNLERFENLVVDRESKRQSLGIAEEDLVVGSVGRLTLQKGYAVLLDAAKQVLTIKSNVKFLIVGTGELENHLKMYARQLGIEEHILFTGSRNDVEELLHVMDLFVNSSLWEGLPTVILESMAARIPVVATRVSGNAELIDHERTGLLVPPSDPIALANAINRFLEHRDIALACAENAHSQVKMRFSIRSVAQQYEDLYLSYGLTAG